MNILSWKRSTVGFEYFDGFDQTAYTVTETASGAELSIQERYSEVRITNYRSTDEAKRAAQIDANNRTGQIIQRLLLNLHPQGSDTKYWSVVAEHPGASGQALRWLVRAVQSGEVDQVNGSLVEFINSAAGSGLQLRQADAGDDDRQFRQNLERQFPGMQVMSHDGGPLTIRAVVDTASGTASCDVIGEND